MKLQENEVNFATLFPKLCFTLPLNMKIDNKVLIEVNGVQFWSEMPTLCRAREFVQ